MDRWRQLRPSERRYARLLAITTPLSIADTTAVIRLVGRQARRLIGEAARAGLSPIGVAMIAAGESHG